LERAKAESSRILEMIKTGDPETAAQNIQFLVDSGLIDDPTRLQRLKDFLAARKPGSGPSLPASNAQYRFEPSEALTSQIASALDQSLQDYIAYLGGIGFDMGESERVTIKIEEGLSNAYYQPTESVLVIGADFAADPEAGLREFSHHVLVPGDLFASASGETRTIESGLADYFVCSFRGDAAMGEIVAGVLKIGPYLRNLDNQRRYDELANLDLSQPSPLGAEVWGGAFWEMRSSAGKEQADRVLARAWLQVIEAPADGGARGFVAAVLDSARAEPPEVFGKIESVLERRGFPLP
jgi:hypothetical protein